MRGRYSIALIHTFLFSLCSLWSLPLHAEKALQLSAPQLGQAVNKNTELSTANKGAKQISLRRASTFPEWRKNKVANGKAHKTLLSLVSSPKSDEVEQVVFISAGQQQPDPRNIAMTANGYPNVLTGQYRHYSLACKDQSICPAKIKPGSLADRIIKSGQFPLKSTLMVLVFDSQFNHTVSEANKIRMENAYWDFLTSRFNVGKVKQVSLIGQSKGGCLAFSLGKRFRNTDHYKNVPLVVQGYDPVCKQKRLTHTGPKRYFSNPLKKQAKYKSLFIDMNKVFPANNRKNLAILNIHSGAPVVLDGVHSFTFRPNNADMGWWKQTWVPYDHTPMGGDMRYIKDTVIPGFNHLMKSRQQFASYVPSGHSALAGNNSLCPKLFPKKVGTKSGKPVCLAHAPNKIKVEKCTNRNSPGQIWSAKYCIWQKQKYWHARPLKAKDSSQKCPVQLPRKVDSLNGKPVCMAALVRKIKEKNCPQTHGSNCVWDQGQHYKARPLKD